MTDSREFFDPTAPEPEDELPILTDEAYEEAREALAGKEVVKAPSELLAAGAEQLLYAKILSAGMLLGLALLLTTFLLYISGIIAPAIPIEELPRLWTLSAHDYLQTINREFLHREALVTGWGWVALLGKGDFLNFVGIALLAAVTIGCYLGISPTLLRKKDWIYGTIALLEVIILALAASGIVSVGH